MIFSYTTMMSTSSIDNFAALVKIKYAYCKYVLKNGIEYWIDKEGIYSSSNYKELIVNAIDVSKAVIFISSENSNTSINVIREIG